MKVELSAHYTYRNIVRSVLPNIAMVLVTSVYSIVDGFFISNFASKSGFAAINLVWPAMMMVGALGQMVSAGGASLVAKLKGEGYPHKADRVFSMLVAVVALSGVVLAALMALFAPQVARLLGSDEAMLPECVLYTRICMAGMPAFMTQMAFQAFYMAAERPQLGTAMAVVAGVINIALDALLVWALGMGVAGAAIATVTSQVVGGVFPLWYFSSSRNRGSLRLVHTRILWRYVGQACSNGLSEYVSNITLNIVSIVYNLQLMRHLGEDGVAAYGIVMYISFIAASILIGYNIGITPIIGYHYGARHVWELRSLFRKSLVVIAVAGTAIALLSELLSSPIARLFVGYDAALAALTVRALRIYMLCFLICGWNMFVSALFTGLNNGLVSAVDSFARSLVFELGAVLLLPPLVGIDGIWWAVNVSEGCTLLLSAFLVARFAPQLVRRRR